MRHLLWIISISLISSTANAQFFDEFDDSLKIPGKVRVPTMTYPTLGDTLSSTVDISNVQLSNKVVKAPLGRVIFYFDQKDYLNKTLDRDTFFVKPKYLNLAAVNVLLKRGNVKIHRKSTQDFVSIFSHRKKQFTSMMSRIYSFEDDTSFFMCTEIFGIMPKFGHMYVDSAKYYQEKATREAIVPKKEFAYLEEFPSKENSTIISIKDYFPLEKGQWYVHQSPNAKYGDMDTTKTVEVALSDGKAIYFAEHQYPSFRSGLIDLNMVGWPGLYFYQNDTLFGISADWESQIKDYKLTRKKAEVFMPAIMAVGDSIENDHSSNRQVLTFLKMDPLKMNDQTFNDCAKFKILTYWDNTTYLSYFWLQKGIGLVKRQYDTGLTKEFVESFMKDD